MNPQIWRPDRRQVGPDAGGGANPIVTFVPVTVPFPGVEPTFQTFRKLLAGLSRTDTLIWCARLNAALSNPLFPDRTAVQQMAGAFLTPEEVQRVNEHCKQHGGLKQVWLLFRGQLLELIRWVCLYCTDKPDDGNTFNDPEVRRRFIQAALIASELWRRRVYDNRFSGDTSTDELLRRLIGPFRVANDATRCAMVPYLALAQAKCILWEQMPRFHPAFEEDFRHRTGLSLNEYYVGLCAIAQQCLNVKPEDVIAGPAQSDVFNPNEYTGGMPELCPVFEQFFKIAGQTSDELKAALWRGRVPASEAEAGPYNYHPMREKPLLITDDGRAIVLDSVFYTEQMAVGPLFYLLGEGVKEETVFSPYGQAFEAHVHALLAGMYPQPAPGMVGLLALDPKARARSRNKVQIADACLNYGTDLVLFEAKAVWIRDERVLDEDHQSYLQYLCEKYAATACRKKGQRAKGVAQLAQSTAKMASGEWMPDDNSLLQASRIYPVLLVHDPLLDSPGHCYFLAEEFKRLLQPDKELPGGQLRKGRFCVMPLTIMTLQDLQNLETSVKRFSLCDLLRDYSEAFPERKVSLGNYLVTSSYAQKLCPSDAMIEKFQEMMDVEIAEYLAALQT